MPEEKGINVTSAAGRKPANGVAPVKPGHEPVRCAARPEMPVCNMGGHGFICHFNDGSCLRHPKPVAEE